MVAISTGHSKLSLGAVAPDGTVEYDLNLALLNEVIAWAPLIWWRCDAAFDNLPYPEHLNRTIAVIQKSEMQAAIEIHHNSCANPHVHGGMVIYWDENPGGKKLAEKIAGTLEAYMPFLSFMDFKKAWRNLQRQYYDANALASLQHIKRRLAYLHLIKIPAVIIEPGYMSNAADLKFVQEYRNAIGTGIAYGVLRFINGRLP